MSTVIDNNKRIKRGVWWDEHTSNNNVPSVLVVKPQKQGHRLSPSVDPRNDLRFMGGCRGRRRREWRHFDLLGHDQQTRDIQEMLI